MCTNSSVCFIGFCYNYCNDLSSSNPQADSQQMQRTTQFYLQRDRKQTSSCGVLLIKLYLITAKVNNTVGGAGDTAEVKTPAIISFSMSTANSGRLYQCHVLGQNNPDILPLKWESAQSPHGRQMRSRPARGPFYTETNHLYDDVLASQSANVTRKLSLPFYCQLWLPLQTTCDLRHTASCWAGMLKASLKSREIFSNCLQSFSLVIDIIFQHWDILMLGTQTGISILIYRNIIFANFILLVIPSASKPTNFLWKVKLYLIRDQ